MINRSVPGLVCPQPVTGIRRHRRQREHVADTVSTGDALFVLTYNTAVMFM
jgi:hypothetical protein